MENSTKSLQVFYRNIKKVVFFRKSQKKELKERFLKTFQRFASAMLGIDF